MRNALKTAALLFTVALAAPDFIVDFIPAVPGLSTLDNSTIGEAGDLELAKRQGPTSCDTGYRACNNLGAPGLCCRTNEICSADQANHVACCPVNFACVGTIVPVNPGVPPVTPTVTTTTQTGFASTTTTTVAPTGSFVQTGGSSARSWVANEFYPFPYIPTTYNNAAACSQAYTSCQQDAAQCTSALANGQPGVTVSGPNGGATITAIASLGQVSASAVCSSLSLEACSGLIVEACASFGGGSGAAPTGCAHLYGVGAGVAVGIAGQLLM